MKAVRIAAWTMIGTGTLVLLFLAYQLLFTNLLTARAQDRAAAQLDVLFDEAAAEPIAATIITPEPADPPPRSTAGSTSTTTTTLPKISYFAEDPVAVGEEFGRLLIPAADVDVVVFEGVDRDTLKNGPGHMPWTPLPGQAGNAVLSGHRTTYGAPFYDLNELEPGDEIRFESVVGEHVYVVRESLIVEPTDVWVTNHRPGAWLTLTTCHPRFSARQRLVIVAEMVEGPNLEYAQGVRDGLIEAVSS